MTHIDMMHKLSDQIIGLKALNAELLAALEACIPVLQKVDYLEGIFDIFVQARAVIAKAKTKELEL